MLKERLLAYFSYNPTRRAKEEWEVQYLNADWKRLRNLEERARYSVIAGYSTYFKPGGSILDIGCGEGVLLENLRPHRCSRYVGLDISQEAIRHASRIPDETTSFVCADATCYIADERFDIIIFNESLYYFAEPLSMVRKYEGALNRDGIIIVSMYQSARNKRVWDLLEKTYTVGDSTIVTNRDGTSWKIACWSGGLHNQAVPE